MAGIGGQHSCSASECNNVVVSAEKTGYAIHSSFHPRPALGGGAGIQESIGPG